MAERVIVRQNKRFETEFLAIDPELPDSQDFKRVAQVAELTPYGMLLAGLAGCTAIVLHTYAQNHGLALEEVELRLVYDRVFSRDCEECEDIERYTEQIEEEILLAGALDESQRQKLYAISKQCPIHKMLESGVHVQSRLLRREEVGPQ